VPRRAQLQATRTRRRQAAGGCRCTGGCSTPALPRQYFLELINWDFTQSGPQCAT
jgi:hypothetical protein